MRQVTNEKLNISHQIRLRGKQMVFAWIPAHVGITDNKLKCPQKLKKLTDFLKVWLYFLNDHKRHL